MSRLWTFIFPVHRRITYKLATIIYKCLRVLAPPYLADDCVPVTTVAGRRHLRSADSRCLVGAHATLRSLVLLCGTVCQLTFAMRPFLCRLLPEDGTIDMLVWTAVGATDDSLFCAIEMDTFFSVPPVSKDPRRLKTSWNGYVQRFVGFPLCSLAVNTHV